MDPKVARMIRYCFMGGLALYTLSQTAIAGTVVQTNLVSDIPGEAANTDPNLLNPWGVSFTATSPVWVSDEAANVSTLYQGTGASVALVVSVPGGPTGQVFNSVGPGSFQAGGSASTFLFDTLGGAIYGWSTGTSAQLGVATAGASFTGLSLDNNGSANFLYAANNAGSGGIDVFDSSLSPTILAGSFTDPNLPAGYVPYNIQNIGGDLYVEYDNASTMRTLGSGVVSVFDANGNFLNQLIGPGGQLESPWGITIAPTGFFDFSNDLLVGNFGNGEINAFDPVTGAFLGTLSDSGGNPIVNQDLWALAVRTGGTFDTSAVYFTAGINHEQDGLFGELTSSSASPEPESLGLSLCALVFCGIAFRLRQRSQIHKIKS